MVRLIRRKGLRRLDANWRVVFRFEAGDARDIDLIDYH
jgi:plasmid maintenance system killer protein